MTDDLTERLAARAEIARLQRDVLPTTAEGGTHAREVLERIAELSRTVAPAPPTPTGFTHGDARRLAGQDAPLRDALTELEKAAVDPRIATAFAQAHIRGAAAPESVESRNLRLAAAANPVQYPTTLFAPEANPLNEEERSDFADATTILAPQHRATLEGLSAVQQRAWIKVAVDLAERRR